MDHTGNDKTIVLTLDSQYKIKYEEYEDFEKSFFREVYDKISDSVIEIIEKNSEMRREWESEKFHREDEQICNIVSVLGKRGSGKSSVLASYCGFLEEKLKYDNREGKGGGCAEIIKKTRNENVSFTVLERIDATLLESDEDLIAIVLAKMLAKLDNIKSEKLPGNREGDQQDFRLLNNEIGKIYDYVSGDKKSREQKSEDDPPIIRLRALSNSWNLRKAFKELVQQYIRYIKDERSVWKDNYIVIPIDDVDMNVKGGIGILERIRKFLMVPNVIIILTLNYLQMKYICECHFYDQIGVDKRNAGDREEVLVGNLTLEYLEKLLPNGRNVLLPELYVNGEIEDKHIVIKGDCLDGFNKNYEAVPEKYISNVIRFYTGVVFDTREGRNYFLKPNSIRKLNNFVRGFLCFRSVMGSRKYQWEAYERNIAWLNEDIMHRYIDQCEVKIDRGLIEGFCKSDLSDKLSYVADYLIKRIAELDAAHKELQGKERSFGEEETKWFLERDRDKEPFGYGDVTYLLYLSDKVKALNAETLFCMRMLISIRMTYMVMSYSVAGCESDKERWLNRMKEFTKNDIIGYWGKWLRSTGLNEIRNNYNGKALSITVVKTGINSGSAENGVGNKEKTEEELEKSISQYIFCRMFLRSGQGEAERGEYNTAVANDIELRLPYDRKFTFQHIGFLNNILDFPRQIDTAASEVEKQLKDVYGLGEDALRVVGKCRDSVLQEYAGWAKGCNNAGENCPDEAVYPVIIPFYSVDFMISFFVRMGSKYRAVDEKTPSAFYEQYRKLVESMLDTLREYDSYYEDLFTEGNILENARPFYCRERMCEHFKNSPIVQKLCTGEEKVKRERTYLNVLNDMSEQFNVSGNKETDPKSEPPE